MAARKKPQPVSPARTPSVLRRYAPTGQFVAAGPLDVAQHARRERGGRSQQHVHPVVGHDQHHAGCRFLPQQGTDRLLDAVFLVVCRDDRHYLRRIMQQVVG